MTIQPSVSQTVNRYITATKYAGSNIFIGRTATPQTIYRSFNYLAFGVDVVEQGFTFTWDLIGETLTIESSDTNLDLQKSKNAFQPYTLSATDNTLVEIGLDDNQPTDPFIARFRYTITGSPSSWTVLTYCILYPAGATFIPPLDPRVIANDVNMLQSFTANFTANATTGGSATASCTNLSFTGSQLANIIGTYTTVPSVTDSITQASANANATLNSIVRKIELSGADAIIDGSHFYKTCCGGNQDGVFPTVSGVAGTLILSPTCFGSHCSRYSTANINIVGFTNEDNMILGVIGGANARGTSTESAYQYYPVITGEMFIERYVSGGNPRVPVCANICARWRSISNTAQGSWNGIDQAEVDLLPEIIKYFGGASSSSNPGGYYGTIFPGPGGGGTRVQSGSFSHVYTNEIYYDYSQCECSNLSAVYKGLTLGTAVPPYRNLVIFDPSLITDSSSIKAFGGARTTSTSVADPCLWGGYSQNTANSINCGVIQSSAGLILSTAINAMNIFYQQYDANGQLLPY